MQAMNRAQFRDSIRRKLQITPPIDLGQGPAGAAPANRPNPSNPQINDALNEAIRFVNRMCEFHVALDVTISVAAAPANTLGPYTVDLTTVGQSQILPNQSISNIRRLEWTDSTGLMLRIVPVSYHELDRSALLGGSVAGMGGDYSTYTPGAPQVFWVEGYTLHVLPYPNIAGTFSMVAGTALLGLQADLDIIDQLPMEHQDTIMYQALVLLSISPTIDPESSRRAAAYQPLALKGIDMIAKWYNTVEGAYQPSLVYQPAHRTRRNRR